MKSTKEILLMLIHELVNNLDRIKSINPIPMYYNEVLGNASFLMAGLLESLLRESSNEWDERKWIDDSLITDVIIRNSKLIIEGVMIWGKMDVTEQWTDPFSFEIELLRKNMSFKKFTFSFCDSEKPEITYGEFRNNRNYWTKGNRKWKYVICSNENLT